MTFVIDIDECKVNELPCKDGQYCSNTQGSYVCLCKLYQVFKQSRIHFVKKKKKKNPFCLFSLSKIVMIFVSCMLILIPVIIWM